MVLKCILGRKEGMTQYFTPEGEMVPVTVIEAGPCYIVQVKNSKRDGYNAVQLGFKEQKLHRITKPLKGHFKKAGISDAIVSDAGPSGTETSGADISEDGGKKKSGEKKKSGLVALKYMREFPVSDPSEYSAGDCITVETFEEGDLVDVIGTSKGRGFAGVMKRWNFSSGPASHGGMCDRRPGSIGMHSDPSRVFKGKKMAGHYGAKRITVKNLEIKKVDPERNVLLIRGAVPGARNGLLFIRKAKTGVLKKKPADQADASKK